MHAALESLGYRCESVPVPNKKAFQLGKEYGNNGQCNPDLLHRGQPGAVRAGPRSQGPDQGRDLRPLRLLHRRRLRPLPLRHVRIGIPAGPAQRGLRQVPRAALPAERRPEPGRSRSRPGNEPGLLPGHPERAEHRRHHQRRGLPDSPLRGERRRDRPRPRRVHGTSARGDAAPPALDAATARRGEAAQEDAASRAPAEYLGKFLQPAFRRRA